MAIGRPREFDLDKALDQALEVFWRNGYEGASIADLTEAMGINPPSLYAAFGNKEGLFRKALDRYVEQRTDFWNEALEAPTARGMVEHLLRDSADFLTEECNPPGCLIGARRARVQRGRRRDPARTDGAPRDRRGLVAGALRAREGRGRAAAGPRSGRLSPATS